MAILAKPRSVRFVQMLRLGVVIFLAVAGHFLLRKSFGDDALYVIYIPLGALILVNILSTIWLYQRLNTEGTLGEEQLYLQIFLDVMIVGMAVFYTGPLSSNLWGIFIVPIVLASAFLYLRGSIFAASLSAVALATLYILDANQMLAGYGEVYRSTPLNFEIDEDQLYIMQWAIIGLVLFTVAVLSGWVAENQLVIIRELGELTGRLERFRINTADVLANIETGLLTVDSDGNIIFLNRAAREILQFEGPEPEGRNFGTVFSGRLEPLGRLVKDTLDGVPRGRRNEINISSEEGRIVPLGVSPTVMKGEQGVRGVVLIFQDLTEAKLMEEKLRRQDRLAVIGELAAGIAHELRNPLASISGSAEVLSDSLPVEGEDERLLALVVNESARINDIVEGFLNYSRIQEADRQPTDIRSVVGEVVALAQTHPSYTAGCELEVDLDEGLIVMADAGQLKQVFLNLILNGLEAMDGPGSVRIEQPAKGDEMARDPGLIEIWVQDDGPGIPDSEVDSIFEPFYTNKRGGYGLGLAVAHRIVYSHEGEIVYMPSGDGKSTFRVILPRGEMEQ